MADFTVRADSVNVEQIMDQIRARIREKRGVDYTEQQIREMAAVKLEKFIDPTGVRSDLLEQFRNASPRYTPPELPNYAFEAETMFDSHRGLLRFIRRLLQPILKLFFNPNPLIQALHIQAQLNTVYAEREARREAGRHGMDQLYYEVMHNLVLETTRMAIEVKNLKMRVESLTGRLEFSERRARALESVVVYRPSEGEPERTAAPAPIDVPQAPAETAVPAEAAPAPAAAEGPGQRSRRRRRRRGRRGTGPAAAMMADTPREGATNEFTGEPGEDSFEGDADADADHDGATLASEPQETASDHRPDAPEPPQSAAPDVEPPSGSSDPHRQ